MSKFSSAWRAPPPGARVNACMPDAYMVLDPCVHLDNRWSTLRVHRIYEVLGPFGAGGDDCSQPRSALGRHRTNFGDSLQSLQAPYRAAHSSSMAMPGMRVNANTTPLR